VLLPELRTDAAALELARRVSTGHDREAEEPPQRREERGSAACSQRCLAKGLSSCSLGAPCAARLGVGVATRIAMRAKRECARAQEVLPPRGGGGGLPPAWGRAPTAAVCFALCCAALRSCCADSCAQTRRSPDAARPKEP
jgi:hypothetical protein